MNDLFHLLPPEGVKILLVLFLSFLVGLEREEHKTETDHYAFGGVRTFPLIGLVGYAMAFISGDQLIPLTIGFAVVAAFLIISYSHKLSVNKDAGVTTEVAGLTIYLIGALVFRGQFWIATTLAVAGVLLLELKVALQNLTKKIPEGEILTFAKFLLLSAVILPVLPNNGVTRFQINPFKTWLVVVAVSAVSYGSYVVQRWTKARGGIIVAALLGGAYSSTITTIVFSKRASREKRPHAFSAAILMASGVMYLRLAVLVGIFNRALFHALWWKFLVLAGLAALGGFLWSRIPDGASAAEREDYQAKNPLELSTAFLFAGLFLVMLIATNLAVSRLGKAGVYSLAAIMGLADVDPFIMGMTQSAGSVTPLQVAAASILVAAASNNFVKGVYSFTLCDSQTGRQSLILLILLALLGLVPIFFL